jgi:hypothetical protein
VLSKYVTDADGTAGEDGDGEALADADVVGSGDSEGSGAALGDAELSGAGLPLKTSAIEGATCIATRANITAATLRLIKKALRGSTG